ncbi:Gag-Pol polyprotein [Plecturocebus cupreus]
MVVKFLLNEIIPRHGLPFAIGSDNRPVFTLSIAPSVSKALNIQRKLHCAYRPQSSGQVEHMNQTVKSTLTELILETSEGWTELLPLALLRVRCTPYKAGFSPFEIMYGRAPPILPRLQDAHLAEISQANLLQYLQSLRQVEDMIQPLFWEAHPNPVPDLAGPCHPFRPGDLVYVRKFQKEGLIPAWKGPHTVILTTPTALKVDGIPAWIHHSRIKKASKHQEKYRSHSLAQAP